MNAQNYSDFLHENNQSIRGYPHYKLYKNGMFVKDYNGRAKKSRDIVNFLMKESGHQIRVANSEK